MPKKKFMPSKTDLKLRVGVLEGLLDLRLAGHELLAENADLRPLALQSGFSPSFFFFSRAAGDRSKYKNEKLKSLEEYCLKKQIFEFGAVQRCLNLVDLARIQCCKMRIWL